MRQQTIAPEIKSGEGGDVAEAFDDFMHAFDEFKQANDERLSQIESRFGVDGVTFLEADYKLSCSSETYQGLRMLAAVGIVVYPIGVNVLYTGLLWRSRASIQEN